ncbi:MAG: MDR family MFS transporter [Thermomicrobiales bacterium]
MAATVTTSSPPKQAPPGSDPSGTFSHRQIMVIIGGLMAGMLLAALDQSIVGTALPVIVSDLGGLNHLSWVVTAYLLTSTAMTPLWGKISDLYGRRIIFQMTIIIFLIGSALCGLSQNMPQLIIFRAIQGIGGGGLMAIAFAIIGDVIPPRERGRYQGYFGAVFGFSSVAGPLLGGYLTDALSWRWIFYVNLPIGIVALVVTSMVLKMPVIKRNHKIDYLGASMIVAGVTSLLLYLNWAGEHYGWTDPSALMLVGLAIVFTIAFIFVEFRADEPIIPMRLFRNPIFTVGNTFGFLIGFAMFGGAIYLPLYFQAVMGMSPTRSGLAMLPMVIGIFSMSIVSGQLITRTGKYKIYPIIGSVILIASLVLLSSIKMDTAYWVIAIYAYLFGTGLGLAMMTIVTPIQNAVEMRDMGVATSSTTFGRSLGGAIGVALFGAILSTRLSHYLLDAFSNAGGVAGAAKINSNDVSALQSLTEPARSMVLTAYTHAITDIFLAAIPIIVIALVVVCFLKEIPLRAHQLTVADEEAAKASKASEEEASIPVFSGH